MEQQEKVQYQPIVRKLLNGMVTMKGSNLFITAGFPPMNTLVVDDDAFIARIEAHHYRGLEFNVDVVAD